MNPGRLMILVFWLAVHAGGVVYVQWLQAQKKRFEDFGVELPAFQVKMIYLGDLLVNYWYVASLAVTLICVLFWRMGENPSGAYVTQKLD